MKRVIGCRPISSRLVTVQLRASPFNITIIQVYVPTSSYDGSEVDEFYGEIQSLVDQTPKEKHEQGVGSLVHKDIVKRVIGCRPISSKLVTVQLRASPFNITIIQVYAPTPS